MTKHKQNAIQPERDRTGIKSGAPCIEVTPEMIEAGLAIFYDWVETSPRDSLVERVYRAMREVEQRAGDA